jgi:hypothetical protein
MNNEARNTTVLDIINQNSKAHLITQPEPKVRIKTKHPRSQILWTALSNNPFKYMTYSTSRLGREFDLCKTQAWKVKATMINYANAGVPTPPLWKKTNPRFKPSSTLTKTKPQ